MPINSIGVTLIESEKNTLNIKRIVCSETKLFVFLENKKIKSVDKIKIVR